MNTIIFDYYKTLYNPISGRLFRGSQYLLKNLVSKYRLILISTSSSDRFQQIAFTRINKYIPEICLIKSKNSRIFSAFIADPDQTLVIGDRLNEEIKIGRNLGCEVLQVNSKKENPIITINNYLSKI